jgi:hypothetical protein
MKEISLDMHPDGKEDTFDFWPSLSMITTFLNANMDLTLLLMSGMG